MPYYCSFSPIYIYHYNHILVSQHRHGHNVGFVRCWNSQRISPAYFLPFHALGIIVCNTEMLPCITRMNIMHPILTSHSQKTPFPMAKSKTLPHETKYYRKHTRFSAKYTRSLRKKETVKKNV